MQQREWVSSGLAATAGSGHLPQEAASPHRNLALSGLRRLARRRPLLVAMTIAACHATAAAGEPMVGCYPCDSLVQRYWRDPETPWQEQDPTTLLRDHGFGWLRVGVTTQSHPQLSQTGDWATLPWQPGYWSCREVAERVLADAAHAGMRLYLFFFLSDTAAHGGRQMPPEAWKNADLLQTCQLLERHCSETVAYFRGRGLDIEVYEVGNEIERGICGFRPDERVPRPAQVDQLRDLQWMRHNIWTPEALLLMAAIRGIKQADPEGRIVLHIATRPSPEDPLVIGFFEAMVEAGVPFDYAGLSLYPWVGYPSAPPKDDWRADLEAWVAGLAQLGKPGVICEYSYPHHPVTAEPGTVVSALPGYPFSVEGQAAWVRDFLRWCRAHPAVAGSLYFYPDYAWRAEDPAASTQGLFLAQDGRLVPAPALLEFQGPPGTRER